MVTDRRRLAARAIDADGGVIAVFDTRDPITFAGLHLGAHKRSSLIVARRWP